MKNLNKKVKALLFFSFYAIFFTVLIIFVNGNSTPNQPQEEEKKEEIVEKNISFSNIFDINYQYTYEVNNDGDITTYQGTKEKIDYDDSEYKYFFDIYNINQLIKKSKVIEKIDNYSKYSLDNHELDELLGSETTGNTIIEMNEKEELEISLDLHNYYSKNIFMIKLIFKVGEEND